jgi:hypothetical protein
MLSDATRVRARTRVTQRERTVLATGRVHFAAEPGGGSPVKRPYRLSELPRHVPFAALTQPRVSGDGFALALGLDVDRHVVELQCCTAARLTVGIGDDESTRRPLIDIVLAGVERADVRVLHGNDLFGPLDIPDDGRHVLVIADIATMTSEQFRTVLDWMEIDRSHHVLALGDRMWWKGESVSRAGTVIHLDHTKARLHVAGRDVEIRLGTPSSGISHRR